MKIHTKMLTHLKFSLYKGTFTFFLLFTLPPAYDRQIQIPYNYFSREERRVAPTQNIQELDTISDWFIKQ